VRAKLCPICFTQKIGFDKDRARNCCCETREIIIAKHARERVGPEACVERHALDCKRSVALGEVAALPQDLSENVVDEGERHETFSDLGEGRNVGHLRLWCEKRANNE